MNRVAVVYIRDSSGDRYAITTAGDTLFEVVRAAVRFFQDPFWRGPKPRPETVLEVYLSAALIRRHRQSVRKDLVAVGKSK